MPGRAYSARPSAAMAGPTVSGSRLPDPRDQAARPSRQREHDERKRQQRRARRGGGVVLDLNEVQRHEEQDHAQRRVQQQRQDVGERERARAKERERQHRVLRTPLDDDEQRERDDADRQRAEHERMAGAERRPFEQSEDDAAQAEDGERRAGPVDPRRPRRDRGSRS